MQLDLYSWSEYRRGKRLNPKLAAMRGGKEKEQPGAHHGWMGRAGQRAEHQHECKAGREPFRRGLCWKRGREGWKQAPPICLG